MVGAEGLGENRQLLFNRYRVSIQKTDGGNGCKTIVNLQL